MGRFFDVKHFALHDGPGIRTTLFFKGCPLSCLWCHNPESISPEIETVFSKENCIECGHCDDCPTSAKKTFGYDRSVDDIIEVILKNKLFFEESEGGVTLSGGEPLGQIDMLEEVLMACKEHNIHTVVDTSGYSLWSNFERINPYVDLYYYDIKHMNESEHIKYTGVPHKLILDNLKRLKEVKQVIIRCPVVLPVHNQDHWMALGEFLDEGDQVHLLAYHDYAAYKYEQHLKPHHEFITPSEKQLIKIKDILEQFGLDVKIGG